MQRPEASDSPGAGVTGARELSRVTAGNPTWVLWTAVSTEPPFQSHRCNLKKIWKEIAGIGGLKMYTVGHI